MRAMLALLCVSVAIVAASAATIDSVAGTGERGYSGDGGPATKATLDQPFHCDLDGKGALLIADAGDWRVRWLDLKAGTIGTFAGTGRKKGKVGKDDLGDGGPAAKALIHGARAVCADAKGNVYVCQREGNSVRHVSP